MRRFPIQPTEYPNVYDRPSHVPIEAQGGAAQSLVISFDQQDAVSAAAGAVGIVEYRSADELPALVAADGDGLALAAFFSPATGVDAEIGLASVASDADDTLDAFFAEAGVRFDEVVPALLRHGVGSFHLPAIVLQPVDAASGNGTAPLVFIDQATFIFAPKVAASVQDLGPNSFGAIAWTATADGQGVPVDSNATAPAAAVTTAIESSAAASAGLAAAHLGNPLSAENPHSATFSPIANAAVGSGGATAAQVQQALNEGGLSVNGSGIKVGVISDSFNDLGGAAADEASGALPTSANVQVLNDLSSGGTDEGRAMMQIVHDIAPGSGLAFYTAFNSEQDFANGILALAAAGCKVICDDVSYLDEPFFQNGIVAQAIQAVEAQGVTYITSAGNEASNGYQAAWTPTSGTFDGVHLTDAESFGGGLVQTITIGANSNYDVPLLVEWNQAYGAATSNIAVLVFSNGRYLGQTTNRSDGEPTNPWVAVDLTAGATYQIAIENLSGANPGLIKEIAEGDGLPVTISGANSGTVFGHAMTPGVITAGAVSVAATPAFGLATPLSEGFSSSGAGTELLFADNGTALPSPDELSPVVVSGLDDIHTTVPGGLSDFYGTSAASASLAGVAALILAANPTLTPVQVEQTMEESAIPMANSAVSGAGLVQVTPAVAAAALHVVIESAGSTSLTEVGVQYHLYGDSGTGPTLSYAGAPVTAGEFAGWTPIGAEAVTGGYDVAWHNADAALYTAWSVNSSGAFTGYILGLVPATDTALEMLETTFSQDLNGDGTTGLPPPTVIENHGVTDLDQSSSNYFLFAHGTTTGPELQYNGAPVTAGEFAGWTPIGAEAVTGGYDVAWYDASASLYTAWNVNGSGVYTGSTFGIVSGTDTALERLETTFNQDLNGDKAIGLPPPTVIESHDVTDLDQSGNNYFIFAHGTTTGPELQYNGAPVTAGEFAGWTPIGAEAVTGGYDVAWHNADAALYTAWSVNSSGAYTGNIFGLVPGTDTALETLETTLKQDLNGDGIIGLPPPTVIENHGVTDLDQSGSDYFLFAHGSSTGPEIQYNGAPVTAGEFAGWTPIGAEATAGGYDVAWHNADAGLYTAWSVNSSGVYAGNIFGLVSGTNTALEALEPGFHQDLNGDGTIGVPAAGGALQGETTNRSAIVASAPNAILAGDGGNDTFVFKPDFGQATIANFIPGQDAIALDHTVFATAAEALASAHDDGHGNVVIADALNDTITLHNVTSAQLHQSDFLIT